MFGRGKSKEVVLVSGHQNKGQSVFRGTAYEDHLKALTRVKDRVRRWRPGGTWLYSRGCGCRVRDIIHVLRGRRLEWLGVIRSFPNDKLRIIRYWQQGFPLWSPCCCFVGSRRKRRSAYSRLEKQGNCISTLFITKDEASFVFCASVPYVKRKFKSSGNNIQLVLWSLTRQWCHTEVVTLTVLLSLSVLSSDNLVSCYHQ